MPDSVKKCSLHAPLPRVSEMAQVARGHGEGFVFGRRQVEAQHHRESRRAGKAGELMAMQGLVASIPRDIIASAKQAEDEMNLEDATP
eukprot:766297-Hanusia_phi.AAC.2